MKKQKTTSTGLRKIILDEFKFLIDDFGCELVEQTDDTLFYQLVYKNSTTGVVITYEAREQYINIELYRLINGQIVKNLMHALRSNEMINVFSLDYILKKKALGNKDQILPIHEYGEDAGFFSLGGFSEYVELFTTNLKKYASHILTGDFSDFKNLDAEFRKDYYQNSNVHKKDE